MTKRKVAAKRKRTVRITNTGFLQRIMKEYEPKLKAEVQAAVNAAIDEELCGPRAVNIPLHNVPTMTFQDRKEVRADVAASAYRWKDGRGKAWLLQDMTEEHLRNALMFCTRKLARVLLDTVYIDSATYLVDGLHHMLKECKRRGYRV
jgi:hypothetical protein